MYARANSEATTVNIPSVSVSVGIGSVWGELSGSLFSGVDTVPASGD